MNRRVSVSIFLLGLIPVGCASFFSPAPEVTPAMVKVASVRGDSLETLMAGRRILGERCASCHVLPPVANHSAQEWSMVLEKMAPRARLTTEEKYKVNAYLSTASNDSHR